MTKRMLLLGAVLAPLVLAGCGPDCDEFCDKLVGCQGSGVTDRAQCVQSCDDVGADNPALIECVKDKSCQDLLEGDCFLPKVR